MVMQITRSAPRMALGRAFWDFFLKQENYVAERALPIMPVPEKTAYFSIIESAAMLRPEDVSRRNGAAVARIGSSIGEVQYSCKEYAAEYKVTDHDRALLKSDLNADLVAVQALAIQLKTVLEQAAASLLFNDSTWTGAAYYTDASGAPWDDGGSSSDPVANVLAAKEKVRSLTGMEPNAMIISQVQVNNLLKHSDIIDRIKYTAAATSANIETLLPKVFGLEEILVGKGVYNSANEGQTKSIADIWSDDYAFVFVKAPPGADFMTPCVGRTFAWNQFTAKRYREDQTTSDIYQVRQSVDQKVISKDFAHLIKIDA